MSRVSLININLMCNYREHLGTAYIAAFLRKHNISVSLTHMDQYPDSTVEELFKQIDFTSEFYGFSFYDSNGKLIMELAKVIKKHKPNCKIFVGGQTATSAAQLILQDCAAIDFVVLGDGEYPILDVVKSYDCHKDIDEIPSVITRNTKSNKKPSITCISDMPWPARDYIDMPGKPKSNVARILTSRGCCGQCSFCTFNIYSKAAGTKRWQGRDIYDVFEEIKFIHEKYKIKKFIFNDGSFEDPGLLGKKRIRELCELLINYNKDLSFSCFLRTETFKEEDRNLIKLMRKAGICQVFFGVESGNNEDLKLYNKLASVEDNKRSLKLFKEEEIDIISGFIMLNPLSNKDRLRKNFEFLSEFNDFYSIGYYINYLDVYYGSDIYHHLLKLGLLKPDYSYANGYGTSITKSDQGYYFSDPFAIKLSKFLDETIRCSEIFIKEYEAISFIRILTKLIRDFPENKEYLQKQLEDTKNLICKTLVSYFKYIYIYNDLDYAKKIFPSFENEILTLFSEIKKRQEKLLSKEPYREYYKE